MGDGKDLVDYGKRAFGISAKHWIALQGIHGVVHAAFATKYTWMGQGYLSNVYFRRIASKPIYRTIERGGDLAFFDKAPSIQQYAVGTPDGKPLPLTGW